ncbi:hypothetical protein PMIN04_002273 [Paraphaeosphaeria minitans]
MLPLLISVPGGWRRRAAIQVCSRLEQDALAGPGRQTTAGSTASKYPLLCAAPHRVTATRTPLTASCTQPRRGADWEPWSWIVPSSSYMLHTSNSSDVIASHRLANPRGPQLYAV